MEKYKPKPSDRKNIDKQIDRQIDGQIDRWENMSQQNIFKQMDLKM